MTTLALIDGTGALKYIKGTGAATELDPFISYGDSERVVADETNVISEYLLNTGSPNQAVNGAVTPVEFVGTVVPAGKIFLAARVIIYMESSTAMDSNTFGDVGALANGWQLKVNGVVASIAKQNRELVSYMFDAHGSEIFGKLDRTLIGRYSFNKFTDGSGGLTIREGETISTVVNDDLSTLTYLEVRVQGMYFDV